MNKRSRVQSPPAPKTDWCLGLMIKSLFKSKCHKLKHSKKKCKDVGVNMEDNELFKLCSPTLIRRETLLLFLNVVINGLKYTGVDIGLNN